MRQPLLLYGFAFILGLFFSCQNKPTATTSEEVDSTLDALLQEAIDDSLGDVPGVSMTVIYPNRNIHWVKAKGFADKTEDTPLLPEQPYRIASITKTYVAAAIFRLHEMDSLDIDDPISHHISAEHRDLLVADGYQPEEITLRHCLLHTSGLYDYAVSSPAYIEAASKNAKRRWSRTDQLRFAMDLGQPRWPAGSGFHYSDTGYILLGEAIERSLDSTLAYGLRSLLKFESMGLKNTWLETVEPAPADALPVVRRYYGKQDFTEWDASVDLWGGGGLLATSEEVALFVQALFTGHIFDEASTLQEFMKGPADFNAAYDASTDPGYMDYRSGHEAFTLYNLPALSHSGFWGSAYLYLPDLEATIAVNYTAGFKQRLLKKTVLALRSLEE